LDRFEVEMSSKIYWGSTQTLSVWSVDVDSEASRKIRKNEHFESMLKHKWNAGRHISGLRLLIRKGTIIFRVGLGRWELLGQWEALV
jgi:hypothetical protein